MINRSTNRNLLLSNKQYHEDNFNIIRYTLLKHNVRQHFLNHLRYNIQQNIHKKNVQEGHQWLAKLEYET